MMMSSQQFLSQRMVARMVFQVIDKNGRVQANDGVAS